LAAAVCLLCSIPVHAQECEYPGVLVVLDRSTSMNGQIGGQTKWDLAVDAVLDLVGEHEDDSHIGLMIYPGPSGTGANGIEGAVGACRVNRQNQQCSADMPMCTTGEVVVPPGPGTTDAILDALVWPAALHDSYTPTWQSLEAVHEYPLIHNVDRRDFVILITDGWQCCGTYRNPEDGSRWDCGNRYCCEPEDRDLAVEKVRQLAEADITTYVIGFGGSVDKRTLHRMAVAAGTGREGCDPDDAGANGAQRCYFQADSEGDLDAALAGIGRQIEEELCDGKDNDCDLRVDEDLHIDCVTACGPGQRTCVNGQWSVCSARDAAAEECDGEDNDCDGQTDGIARGCANACGVGREICTDGVWGGCDAPQPAEEVCNGEDDNCDEVVDEGCDCQPGETRECGTDVGTCQIGVQSCNAQGQWQPQCEGGVGPQPEECDSVDSDCDGEIDGMTRDCSTECGVGQETCVAGRWQDCEAPEPGPETCNGADDDCDGQVDEALTRRCETACGSGVEACEEGAWVGCTAREPEPTDICGNGADDDCNGRVDDDCLCEDGATQPCGTDRGICERGTQTCDGGLWGTCAGAVYGAAETCNGLDDDCNGLVDDGHLCDSGEVCACGACAGPCLANECDGDATCQRGHCVEDHCPEGRICDNSVCVPGTRPDGPGNGSGNGGNGSGPGGVDGEGGVGDDDGNVASAQCGCAVGEGGTRGLLWLLLPLAALLLRRRP